MRLFPSRGCQRARQPVSTLSPRLWSHIGPQPFQVCLHFCLWEKMFMQLSKLGTANLQVSKSKMPIHGTSALRLQMACPHRSRTERPWPTVVNATKKENIAYFWPFSPAPFASWSTSKRALQFSSSDLNQSSGPAPSGSTCPSLHKIDSCTTPERPQLAFYLKLWKRKGKRKLLRKWPGNWPAAMFSHANCHKDSRTRRPQKGQAAAPGPRCGAGVPGRRCDSTRRAPGRRGCEHTGWQRSENSEACKH